jgi:hypothetical protein
MADQFDTCLAFRLSKRAAMAMIRPTPGARPAALGSRPGTWPVDVRDITRQTAAANYRTAGALAF